MTDRDARRVTIAAPPEGGRSRPPARRRPVVVEPEDPPAPLGMPAVRAAAAPVAEPAPAAAPARAAAGAQRVVVPAGGRPPPRRDAPRPVDRPSPAPSGPAARARSDRPGGRAEGWRRFVPSRRVVLGVAGAFLLVVGVTLAWGYVQFRSIERVDLSAVLADENGTNYLIVGSDTRAGVDESTPNAGAFLGDGSVGGPERSDTILILRVDGDGARMLSVPRDLWVTVSETGQRARINSAFNGGPARLIATLRDQLQLPVHHYIQVDFVAFSSMVDSLGGIDIEFEHPAFDTHSGLDVPEAGRQNLDGTQALAYVRSRFYTEVIDGRNVPEGIGDIGRVQRQQRFLAALTGGISSTRNPLTLMRVSDTLADGMRIDSDLGFFEALNVLRRTRGLEPGGNELPTEGFRTAAGADVLRLGPGADEVLGRFGSSGATIAAG